MEQDEDAKKSKIRRIDEVSVLPFLGFVSGRFVGAKAAC
jgi:hypothetical protein